MAKGFRHSTNEKSDRFSVVINDDDSHVSIQFNSDPCKILLFKEAILLKKALDDWFNDL